MSSHVKSDPLPYQRWLAETADKNQGVIMADETKKKNHHDHNNSVNDNKRKVMTIMRGRLMRRRCTIDSDTAAPMDDEANTNAGVQCQTMDVSVEQFLQAKQLHGEPTKGNSHSTCLVMPRFVGQGGAGEPEEMRAGNEPLTATRFRCLEPERVSQQLHTLMSLRATSLQAINGHKKDNEKKALEKKLAAALKANATLGEELTRAYAQVSNLKSTVVSLTSKVELLTEAMTVRGAQMASLMAKLEEARQREAKHERQLAESTLTAYNLKVEFDKTTRSLYENRCIHLQHVPNNDAFTAQTSEIVALQNQLASVTAMYQLLKVYHEAETQTLRERLRQCGAEHPIEIIDVDADNGAGDCALLEPV